MLNFKILNIMINKDQIFREGYMQGLSDSRKALDMFKEELCNLEQSTSTLHFLRGKTM